MSKERHKGRAERRILRLPMAGPGQVHRDPWEARTRTDQSSITEVARTVHHIVAEAGRAAGFGFPIHPHMLRHACGFYLANKGVDTRALQQYLGHRNIQHTVRYTELTAQRFQNFWED